MLFEHLLEPGDRVVVEQPTYDRTLLLLQRLGVELVPVPLEADGLDVGAARSGARRGADQARPRHPQLPQPRRLHALGREARAAGRARRRARLLDLRGRPLPRAALRGRAAGDDALARQGRAGRPRLLLLEDGQPRRPGRLPGRARRRRSRSSPSAPTRPTSRRTCWPRRSSSSSAAPAGSTATSSSSKARCEARRDALVEALARADPRGRVRRPRGRLLPLARPRRGDRHRRAAGRGEGRGRRLRRRPRLHDRGRRATASASPSPACPPERIAEGVARIAAALERVRTGSPA